MWEGCGRDMREVWEGVGGVWKGYERCGRVWEGCGRDMRGVGGCGRVWEGHERGVGGCGRDMREVWEGVGGVWEGVGGVWEGVGGCGRGVELIVLQHHRTRSALSVCAYFAHLCDIYTAFPMWPPLTSPPHPTSLQPTPPHSNPCHLTPTYPNSLHPTPPHSTHPT